MKTSAVKQFKKSAAKPFSKVPALNANQSSDVPVSSQVPDTQCVQFIAPDRKTAEAQATVRENPSTAITAVATASELPAKLTPQEVLALLRATQAAERNKAAEAQATATANSPTAILAAAVTVVESDATEATEISDATKDLITNLIQDSIVTSGRVVANLTELEQERQDWESTELAANHTRLYAILSKCYGFYMTMKSADTDKDVRSQMATGLSAFIKQRGFKTLDKTHDMNRVVKAVFGEDRRRVSAYASVLRIALTSGTASTAGVDLAVSVSDLPSWIAAKGGIEEIRKVGKTTGVTAVQRAETAKSAVADKPLMSFKPDAKAIQFSTDDADKMMVLIVTYRPTGELEVNSVVKNEAVLRAALSAHYAANKDAMANVQTMGVSKPQTAVSMSLGNLFV